MGNMIGTAVAGKMKEAQQEMIKVQQENMVKAQERQRKVMMSMQIAATREMYAFAPYSTLASHTYLSLSGCLFAYKLLTTG